MRRAYHHGHLPERIIEEARAALLRNPDPSALSIRDLARRIGVSQNAPYRHFGDRRDLLEAVAAAGYRDLARALADRAGDGAEAVGAVWERLATREPGLAAMMVGAGSMSGSDGAVALAARGWLAEIAAAIEPEVGGDNPERLVRRAVGCWAAVLGMAALRRGGLLEGLDEWMVPRSGDLAVEIALGRRP